MKKQINEQQLRDLTARLNEKTSQVDEGVWDDMKAGYKKYAPAFLGGTPAAPAKPTGTQATKPAAPVAAKPDPNVKALQDKLIAAGAKIKADGIMGPATRAAQAQFPNVTTQTDAEKAAASGQDAVPAVPAQSPEQLAAAQTANGVDPATGQNVSIKNPDGSTTNPETGEVTPAANAATPPPPAPAPAPAAAAAPAPGMTAQGDDEGNTTITRPDGSTMVVGADGKQIMPGSNPNLPQNKGVVNTVKNAVKGTGDFQKPTGFQPAPAPVAESVGFQNDELSRIVSLVHHR
jgi:hypothetical protein